MNYFKLKNLLLISLITLLLSGCSTDGTIIGNRKFSPLDFTEIIISGFDGKGEMEINYDWEDFAEKVFGKENIEELTEEEYYDYMDLELALREGIQMSCSKEEDLSNGDEIVIEFVIDDLYSECFDEYLDKLDLSSKNTTVKGLITKEMVFEDFMVYPTEVDGKVNVYLSNTSNNYSIKYMTFTLNHSDDVNLGDSVKVVAEHIEKSYYGDVEWTVSFEKEFKLDKLYVPAERENITSNLVDEIANHYIKVRNDISSNETNFNYSDARFDSAYFRSSTNNDNDNINELIIILTYDSLDREGNKIDESYELVRFYNLFLDENGNILIDIEKENGNQNRFLLNYESRVKEMMEDSSYVTVKIK